MLVEDSAILDKADLLSSQEWRLACRLAASKGLCKSDLLPRFLLFVCEQQLMGKGQEITEQRIGTQIFNRPVGYNPGEDNIVRSYARLLRRRLDEYFEGEGREEPMRIVIPKGGYVPVFQGVVMHESLSGLPGPVAEMVELAVSDGEVNLPPASIRPTEPSVNLTARSLPATGTTKDPSRHAWLPLIAGVLLGLVIALASWLAFGRSRETEANLPTHALWGELFQRSRNTLVVPADSGLGILQNLTGHLVTLDEYANGTYLPDIKPVPGLDLGNLNDLRRQRYTSVVCLNIVAMLAQLPGFAGSRSQIRYARSITTDDLKHSNAILLGSVHSNPWVALFEKDLNFRLLYMPEVDQSYVLNQHPVGTEQARYLNGTGAAANNTYGAIDYLPSLDGTGHVLIIQGLNMAATQAAADILFNQEKMQPILKQAAKRDGTLKSFELLLETSSIGATAPGAQIIAARYFSK
jgi:hypothetical protein